MIRMEQTRPTLRCIASMLENTTKTVAYMHL